MMPAHQVFIGIHSFKHYIQNYVYFENRSQVTTIQVITHTRYWRHKDAFYMDP